MIPLLGTPSRVSEVLRGKKELSLAMVQRLRARFGVPADVLIPRPKHARRTGKRAAASSENDHGSMNLASNTAPVCSTRPSRVAAIQVMD